jgi:hypothetical protein
VFDGNRADGTGGALQLDSGQLELIACDIRNNSSSGSGSAISAGPYADITAAGCAIVDNYGSRATIDMDIYADLDFTNCTMTRNSSGSFLVSNPDYSSFHAYSCIIWGNQSSWISWITPYGSDVEGYTDPPYRVIDEDPHFVTWGIYDVGLRPSSPCIDSGWMGTDSIDWSSIRPAYGVINTPACDMGAYGGATGVDWIW